MRKSIAAGLVFVLFAAACGSGSTSSSDEDDKSDSTEEGSENEAGSDDDKSESDKDEPETDESSDEDSDDDKKKDDSDDEDDEEKESEKSSAAGESKLVQSLVAEFSESGDFDEIAGDGDETVTCLAKGIVDEFGAQRLEELGVTEDKVSDDPDFTAEEEAQMVELTFDCIDVKELLGTVGGLPEELADCVVDEVGEDEIKEIMSAAANGEENAIMETAIEEASTKCAE